MISEQNRNSAKTKCSSGHPADKVQVHSLFAKSVRKNGKLLRLCSFSDHSFQEPSAICKMQQNEKMQTPVVFMGEKNAINRMRKEFAIRLPGLYSRLWALLLFLLFCCRCLLQRVQISCSLRLWWIGLKMYSMRRLNLSLFIFVLSLLLLIIFVAEDFIRNLASRWVYPCRKLIIKIEAIWTTLTRRMQRIPSSSTVRYYRYRVEYRLEWSREKISGNFFENWEKIIGKRIRFFVVSASMTGRQYRFPISNAFLLYKMLGQYRESR